MKLVIPKSIPNVHLLQPENSSAVKQPTPAPVSGAYPLFHDGAKSTRRPHPTQPDSPSVQLGDLVLAVCQTAMRQMREMVEVLPRMGAGVERKQQIVGGVLRVREMVYKMGVLVDFLAARSSDLSLATMGLSGMEKYGGALLRVADALAMSIEHSLSLMTPSLPLSPTTIALLSPPENNGHINCHLPYNLPTILQTDFSTGSVADEDRWIRRLDSLIRKILFRYSDALDGAFGVERGVVRIVIGDEWRMGLTVVPGAGMGDCAWHLLSLHHISDDKSISSVSPAVVTALLIQLQARHNNLPITETPKLLSSLKEDLHLFSLSLTHTRLLHAFTRHHPKSHLHPRGSLSFQVRPWLAEEGPWIRYSLDLDAAVIRVERKVLNTDVEQKDFEGGVVGDEFAPSVVSLLIKDYSRERLLILHNEICSIATTSWILFSPTDIKISDTFIEIALPTCTITVTVSPIDGTFHLSASPIHPSSSQIPVFSQLQNALNTEKGSSLFCRLIRDLRLRLMASLISNHLTNDSKMVLLDGSQLVGAGQFAFGLVDFPGKLLILDLGNELGNKLMLGWESRGRLATRPIPLSIPLISSVSDLIPAINQIQSLTTSLAPLFTAQELEQHGILYSQSNETFTLLNATTLPAISTIKLYPDNLEIYFGFAPFDPAIVQSSIDPSQPIKLPYTPSSLPKLLTRLRGIQSLLLISKQLELREAKHELHLTHLDFGHSKAGRIRISIDPELEFDGSSPSYPKDQLPLTIALGNRGSLSDEHMVAIQSQLRSSANIGIIVEYITRTMT